MQASPRLREFPHYPATTGTLLLALIATLAWWSSIDVTPLFADAHVAHGQFWRLLTSSLLHNNPLHLVFNVYWLWRFGTLIEKHAGAVKTFGLYAFLAAVGTAAEFALLNAGVGLSGITFGLFGLICILQQRDERFRDAIDLKTITIMGAWFCFCILTTVTGMMPVANLTHAAGAIFGTAIGWIAATPSPSRRPRIAWVSAATLTLLLAATIGRPQINLSKHRGYEQASLGYEALLANRNSEAIWWFTDATTMRPDDARSWFNLGIANDRLQQHQLALIAYARAAALDPANQHYRMTRDTLQDYLASVAE